MRLFSRPLLVILVAATLSTWSWYNAAIAEKPLHGYHFDIDWEDTRPTIGTPFEVLISVTSGTSVPLDQVNAVTHHLSSSSGQITDAPHLSLPTSAKVVTHLARFPVTVHQAGEFRIDFVGSSGGHQARRSLFIIALNGNVWLGRDTIESAEFARVSDEVGVPESALTPEQRRIRDETYRARVAERVRANLATTKIPPPEQQ